MRPINSRFSHRSVPKTDRTEGRLTFMYPDDGQIVKQHLTFSESIDFTRQSTTLNIGYVAYEPQVYYARAGQPTLYVNSEGICKTLDFSTSPFVTEISWYLDRLLPDLNLNEFKGDSPHLIGPSGLVAIMDKLAENTGAEVSFTEIHPRVE